MTLSLPTTNLAKMACRIIRIQILPRWGRGTSVAGGGAGEVGCDGVFKGWWLVFGEVWGVGGIGQLACAPPPSCGWFPSPIRGGFE
jgi:hypothetical protein